MKFRSKLSILLSVRLITVLMFFFATTYGRSQTMEDIKDSKNTKNDLEVSALITTGSAGISANVAASSVVRIICVKSGFGGSGFLHKSGLVITAAHVVANCVPSDLIIVLSNGKEIPVKKVEIDTNLYANRAQRFQANIQHFRVGSNPITNSLL